MKFEKMLLATDFSDCSKKAVEAAQKLREKVDGHLDILHVFDPSGIYMPAPYYFMAGVDRWIEDHIKACRERGFESLTELKEAMGDDVSTHFKEGKPGHEIVTFAEENHSDVIVLGTHGYTGINRLMLGSVAEYVVRHANCMVLSVKCD